MIRIAIYDDVLICTQLDHILKNYFITRKIDFDVSQFTEGSDLVEACKQNGFSCVFLAIDLEAEDGIEVAREIRKQVKQPIEIIFMTNNDDCFSKVISLHIFDYILKPIKNKQIECILDDYLLWHLSNKSNENKIQLKTINGFITFYYHDILYLEYKNRRVEIMTKDGLFFIYAKMIELYEIFEKFNFVVPHVAYIINMEQIKCIYKSKNAVIMANDKEIPISQRKAKEFKLKYKEFVLKKLKVD